MTAAFLSPQRPLVTHGQRIRDEGGFMYHSHETFPTIIISLNAHFTLMDIWMDQFGPTYFPLH
jgi:hypothetical protein